MSKYQWFRVQGAFAAPAVVRHRIRLAAALSTILSCALLLSSCSRKGSEILGPVQRETQLAQVVERAGELAESPTHNTETPNSPQDSLGSDGRVWSCVSIRHSIADATGEFPKFDPNTELIWPGAALQGGTISSPSPERIVVPRGGGTVIINNLTGAPISSVTVAEVTQGSIVTSANSIIAAQPSAFPARFFFSASQVQNSSEMAVKLHANASFLGLFSSSASFGFDENDHRNRFLVQLNQSFYTLAFERPSTIDAFFAPSVTAADLDAFVGPQNPPVYVSSVTYGRLFYLLVESTEDVTTMEGSVNASFMGFGGGGSFKHVSQLAGLRVRAFALGGDANAAIEAVRGGAASLDAFLASLKGGNNIATAAPLSYVVRSIRSDRLVRNAIAYDYTTRTCSIGSGPAIRFVASPFFLRQSVAADHPLEGSSMRVNQWVSSNFAQPQSAVAAYQDPFGGASGGPVRLRPKYIADAINGHGAVRFELGTPFLYGRSYLSYMDFDATRLAGKDFTMMFVCRYSFSRGLASGSSVPESCGVVVRGASPGSGLAARFGFSGAKDVFCSQNDAPTMGPRPAGNAAGFAIYTVTQSAAGGSRVYVNGSLAASDPSRTDRLLSFPGAMLGLVGASPQGPIKLGPSREQLDLADALFFDHAMADVSRAEWETRLARSYGLILTGITADLSSGSTWNLARPRAVRAARVQGYR